MSRVTSLTIPPSNVCLSGTVVRAPQFDFIQRGTHRLLNRNGQVIAALRSANVNLFNLENRFVTVCGRDEGFIEGVRSLDVTNVLGTTTAPPFPSTNVDLRLLLLLLLLTNPQALGGIRPDLLLFLLLSGGLGGSGSLPLGGKSLGLGGQNIPDLSSLLSSLGGGGVQFRV